MSEQAVSGLVVIVAEPEPEEYYYFSHFDDNDAPVWVDDKADARVFPVGHTQAVAKSVLRRVKRWERSVCEGSELGIDLMYV
jgi:hypothetical protein